MKLFSKPRVVGSTLDKKQDIEIMGNWDCDCGDYSDGSCHCGCNDCGDSSGGCDCGDSSDGSCDCGDWSDGSCDCGDCGDCGDCDIWGCDVITVSVAIAATVAGGVIA